MSAQRDAAIAEARADGMRTAQGDALSDLGVASPDLAMDWARAYVYGEPGGDQPDQVPIYADAVQAAWLAGYRAGAGSGHALEDQSQVLRYGFRIMPRYPARRVPPIRGSFATVREAQAAGEAIAPAGATVRVASL